MSNKSDLIHVGELAMGFSENVLPDSSELAGKEIKLYFEDGSSTNYKFHDTHRLYWQNEREEKEKCPLKVCSNLGSRVPIPNCSYN